MIVKNDRNEFADYLKDAANYQGTADKIYFPENTEEVAEILRECYKSDIQVTVSGMLTGLTGGGVPDGGIIISTQKLNKIIEINTTDNYAVVETGVILSDLHDGCSSAGLYYPPDPTEQNSSIGGTIANNASGAKTFKYGSTRCFVMELEIVLADGEIISVERYKHVVENGVITITANSGKSITLSITALNMPSVKNASGYYMKENMDLIDLFIGSEGTLGIVTKAKLRLLKQPENFISAVIFFPCEKDALDFVAEVRDTSFRTRNSQTTGIDALGIEFFDRKALEFLKDDYPVIPDNATAAVWIEQEVTESVEMELLELWTAIIEKHNASLDDVWFASDKKDRANFHEFRHAVSGKVNEYITANNLKKVGTDLAVPDSNFTEFYKFCKDSATETGVHHITYGHFGNSHIHLNFLPADEGEFCRAKEMYKTLCEKCIQFGGTVSAEHGIGKIKPDYLVMMYGEDGVNKMASVKKQLDKKGLLGRGNIFSTDYL